MRVLSRASLPSGPWKGRAVLSFRRTAWFSDGSNSMVALVVRGLSPSPRGMELDGPLPPVRQGQGLLSDGLRWWLEGEGDLEGVWEAFDGTVTLEPRSRGLPAPDWRRRWKTWLQGALPTSPEGRWLGSLVAGPGTDWEALMGRGSGSTPLGDDYLGGWLGARWATGRGWDDRRRLAAVLGTTTRLSRHYLSHLAEGRVDAALADFLLADPFPEPDSAPARALGSRGDLSGRATLVGLVAGLSSGDEHADPDSLRSPMLPRLSDPDAVCSNSQGKAGDR